MAECMKNGVNCPDSYKCTDEGDMVESIGKAPEYKQERKREL